MAGFFCMWRSGNVAGQESVWHDLPLIWHLRRLLARRFAASRKLTPTAECPTMSNVSEIPCAAPEAIERRYSERLAFETDCWDVHESLRTNTIDFVLLDVRGPKLYEAGHVPGAINLPHGKMTASRMQQWPSNTLFVVYCAGPHCNGTDRAALRLGKLG